MARTHPSVTIRPGYLGRVTSVGHVRTGSARSAMMTCATCGGEVRFAASRCPRCGAGLASGRPSVAPTAPVSASQPAEAELDDRTVLRRGLVVRAAAVSSSLREAIAAGPRTPQQESGSVGGPEANGTSEVGPDAAARTPAEGSLNDQDWPGTYPADHESDRTSLEPFEAHPSQPPPTNHVTPPVRSSQSGPGPGFKPLPTRNDRLTFGRAVNGLCYAVTGLALVVGQFATGRPPWYLWLFGLLFVGYGVRILVTRSSYWIHTVIYLLPIAGLAYLALRVTGRL